VFPFIQINRAVPCIAGLQFKEPVSWTINQGEHWAVIGPNGAGKTILSDILCRKVALKQGEVRYYFPENKSEKHSSPVQSIAFRDIYGLADYKNMYYQQRFNATENEDVPLVDDLLDLNDPAFLDEMLNTFDLKHLSGKRIIFLSGGELRKFLIVRVLQKRPSVLILDNPFIGLDASSRELLKQALERMAGLSGLQVILLLSSPDDIPEMITRVLPVFDKELCRPYAKDDFLQHENLQKQLFPTNQNTTPELPLSRTYGKLFSGNVFEMRNIHIRYGGKNILNGIDWTVGKGEKWALLGPNGSGKSTLLSLIYADNPQAYSNDIVLFGRKRGTGESIWDIKRRIGYVSPEMHLFYLKDVPAIEVVGSGFFDTVGLYRKCNAGQISVCEEWIRAFGIEKLKDVSFLKLSSGEQRLTLLARAFVKDPSLLILDEPLHGLDQSNKIRVRQIIETFCNRPDKTLIYVTHYREEIPSCVDRSFELPAAH